MLAARRLDDRWFERGGRVDLRHAPRRRNALTILVMDEAQEVAARTGDRRVVAALRSSWTSAKEVWPASDRRLVVGRLAADSGAAARHHRRRAVLAKTAGGPDAARRNAVAALEQQTAEAQTAGFDPCCCLAPAVVIIGDSGACAAVYAALPGVGVAHVRAD